VAGEDEKDYDAVLPMRYAYAKWLVAFTEEHGIGLGDGELAEIEEAEFRIRGLGMVVRSDVPAVESNVAMGRTVLPWEADVLGAVADELLLVFRPNPGEDGDGA